MISYRVSDKSLTFYISGKQYTYASDHPNFDLMLEAIINNAKDYLLELTDVKGAVTRLTFGAVTIDSNDDVWCSGSIVSDFLAKRILNQAEQFSSNPKLLDPLIKFTEKLSRNPNEEVREDLFEWLERGSMPLYPDGDFAAYKLVRDDFRPIRTGPYGQDQSPGKIVSMPRSSCDSNRSNTCSTGLHFCSYEYLPIFQEWNSGTGQKVILLKINPEHVTAIPTDYNLSKGRTCEFYVVEEIDPTVIKEKFGNKLVLGKKDVVSDKVFSEKDQDSYAVKSDAKEKWEAATKAVEEAGSQTKAAAKLGISRSTIARWLKGYTPPATPNSRKEAAEEAINLNGGNKTAAAQWLGIPRSTLYRWLQD